MSGIAKNRTNSTWTPLSNGETNNKIFDERRTLVAKWFDKWNDSQRKRVLEDLIARCKARQIDFAGDLINRRRAVHRDDFSRALPRVLSLYIMSFLDPRSLCRCSQVCWYWKHLAEADEIWMPKCVRLGWILSFTPSPFEVGVWKRHYVENIKALQVLRPKAPPKVPIGGMEKMDLSEKKTKKVKAPPKAQPWRGSDPVPKDTWRNNYLDNDDELEKVKRMRERSAFTPDLERILRDTSKRVNDGSAKPQVSISKSKLWGELNDFTGERPRWAKSSSKSYQNGHSGETQKSVDASIRPAPVQAVKTINTVKYAKAATARTPRDPPSAPLFEEKPWTIPADDEWDSDT